MAFPAGVVDSDPVGAEASHAGSQVLASDRSACWSYFVAILRYFCLVRALRASSAHALAYPAHARAYSALLRQYSEPAPSPAMSAPKSVAPETVLAGVLTRSRARSTSWSYFFASLRYFCLDRSL